MSEARTINDEWHEFRKLCLGNWDADALRAGKRIFFAGATAYLTQSRRITKETACDVVGTIQGLRSLNRELAGFADSVIEGNPSV